MLRPGPAPQSGQPERYLRRTETSAGSTAGSCIRYCIPPDYAGLRLPVPDTLQVFRKYGIRRYGFHGTSHRYVSKRVCEFLNIPQEGSRIITCHIGNGGSIAAVKDGKCIDTTMGLTPLEGLMMGTRCGDIDGGAITYIMKKEGLTPDEMSTLLNKKSGVLGMFENQATCANWKMQ